MLNKNTLDIVDCNVPFAKFIGYDTVAEFLDQNSNFSGVITPNAAAFSRKYVFQTLFLKLLIAF